MAGALAALACLAFADADLNLLLRGKHKPGVFRDKVVWITGASQGLGEVLVRYFAGQGARVILSSRDATKLQRVATDCGLGTDQVMVLPLDLCGPYEGLEAAAQRADDAFGGVGVDYLIHNAGASQHALAAETSWQVADQLCRLNTMGPIHLTRAILPHMLTRGKGRLVVVASMSAKVPSPGQAMYAACKMGLYGYFSSLAAEISDTGVGVTICCPGPIATGSETTPRVVYGADGLIVQNNTGRSNNRLAPQRCAELIANAMAHKLDECWISRHPVLLVGHIQQWLPALGWFLLKKVGPGRARAVKSGRSGYDLREMVGAQDKKVA